MYFIGESRSASELEVFISMPIERLRVGCGLQCTLPHAPLVPSSRPLLFSAPFCWFGCLFAVVVFLCFACAPYPPSYISYEDSSHSEMGT